LIDDPQQAIDQIATHLAKAREPNLVVMVHGFNNPRPAVLGAYAVAANAIQEDPEIQRRDGIVCVGISLAVGKNGKHRAWLARLAAGGGRHLDHDLQSWRWRRRFIIGSPNVKLYLPYIPDFVPGLWNRSGAHV